MSLSLYDLFISMGLFAKSIVIILAAMTMDLANRPIDKNRS